MQPMPLDAGVRHGATAEVAMPDTARLCLSRWSPCAVVLPVLRGGRCVMWSCGAAPRPPVPTGDGGHTPSPV